MNVSWGSVLVAVFWSTASLSAQTSVVARAASVEGMAVIAGPGVSPLLLTAGYVLTPGDRIDTRGGGRVVIDVSDGSLVVVAPESIVVLKDYRTAGSLRELFEITLGAVRVKINHFAGKPNPYRMNSPTASIAVRGTEFTITATVRGETQVDVIEGLVEVAPLNNPAAAVLIGAGRGAFVQPGQELRLIGMNQPPGNRDANDRGVTGRDSRQVQQSAPPGPPVLKVNPHIEEPLPGQKPVGFNRHLAGLGDLGPAPFLLRFNAFSDAHLDSLENPAYASQFRSPEGRLFIRPTALAEGTYGISPQFSFFQPVGEFTLGGAIGLSRVLDSATPAAFYSGALLAARRFGETSLGIEIASLDGPNTSESGISQTRTTLGFARNLSATTTIGGFYRYGFLQSTGSPGDGHSSEAGLHIRGMLTPRLYYGVTLSWLGLGFREMLPQTDTVASHSRERAQRQSLEIGLGYALNRGTVLTIDTAGGSSRRGSSRTEDGSPARLLQNALFAGRFTSVNAAVQQKITRRFFVIASLLQVWQSRRFAVDLFADSYGHRRLVPDLFFPVMPGIPYASRFSDFGGGWRVARDLDVQYLYSTDYGATNAMHSVLLRWTLRAKQ